MQYMNDARRWNFALSAGFVLQCKSVLISVR